MSYETVKKIGGLSSSFSKKFVFQLNGIFSLLEDPNAKMFYPLTDIHTFFHAINKSKIYRGVFEILGVKNFRGYFPLFWRGG